MGSLLVRSVDDVRESRELLTRQAARSRSRTVHPLSRHPAGTQARARRDRLTPRHWKHGFFFRLLLFSFPFSGSSFGSRDLVLRPVG
ncbi:hypothetical protein IE53DRAFT_66806 [Violaceomyces palustris]|uniref:Uncharacterized protein n=1 Tax=Violaceomyces palustris TaxID=1673888 RepID=A0ACD0NZ14_9BASI|nr:hypothetical protein IE53DRAFT_66806 [Violaceomyces palustris]